MLLGQVELHDEHAAIAPECLQHPGWLVCTVNCGSGEIQKELDEAILRQLKEEKRARLELEQLAAEQVEKKRVEQLKKLEDKWESIAMAERKLALKK